MKQNFKINENKINDVLNELNEDRQILFNEIRSSVKYDKLKEEKIKNIEAVQRSLLNFKKTLSKEKENQDI